VHTLCPDQVITDLNNPDRIDLSSVSVDPESGEQVVGAAAVEVRTASDCVRVFRTGVSRIGSFATKLGPSEHRSTSCFALRRTARDNPRAWSTLRIVHLAGTEALSEDATHVEMIGGPDVNRGIAAFASVVNALASDPHNPLAAPSHASKVTSLLQSALGGNCQTHALVHLATSPSSSSSTSSSGGDVAHAARLVRMCADLGRITNYPVLATSVARGLEAHYRRLVSAAAAAPSGGGRAGSGGGGGDNGGGASVALLKLEAENKRLRDKLSEMSRRYTAAVDEKAAAAAATLTTEEQRLEVTKALLDVRIETARVQEEAEAAAFEQVNRILELTRELSAVRDAVATTEASRDAATTRANDLADEVTDLRDELIHLRKSHHAAREALATEREKVRVA
jgi:hypothetical protein